MKKAPDAFRTISEVSDWLETPAHVLRFWESKFSQIKPVKRAGGRRYYRPDDMRLLGGIKQLLHNDGLTIKGVQKILREQGIKHVVEMSPEVTDAAATSRKAPAASDMDSLTEEITKQVASTAKAQEKPSTPEPLKLSELQQSKADMDAVREAAREETAPSFGDEQEAPLFLQREDATVDQADTPEDAEPAPEPDAEKISELYGRLKSLRRRMQEA
jgi:DNA-binding transcriptional MerR regulator